jgi:hypothetical protein
MSKKGGYLIIDLENIDLMTQNNLFSTKKVESLYKLLKSNYHKNVIFNDGNVKITISPQSDYYTIKVTGGTVNGLNYEVYYLG